MLEFSLEKAVATMDRGAWWAAVHGVAKSRTRLSHFTFTFHFPALEKEMATHSSVLAWGIPGTVEPGGLPSIGSQNLTWLKRCSSSSSSSILTVFESPLEGEVLQFTVLLTLGGLINIVSVSLSANCLSIVIDSRSQG